MFKLNSVPVSATVSVVPEAAFAPETKLEVPDSAFNKTSHEYGKYMAYVKYSHNTTTNREYAAFVFVKSMLQKYFKDFSSKQRYEFVQGAAPHKDWFVVRKATTLRGSKPVNHGLIFYNRTYLATSKLDKLNRYPLELVFKEGALYVKLPQDLVPLLR